MITQFFKTMKIFEVREGVKKLDFLAEMSAKLWPLPLSPFSEQKKYEVDFFHLFYTIPIEPECSEMNSFVEKK